MAHDLGLAAYEFAQQSAQFQIQSQILSYISTSCSYDLHIAKKTVRIYADFGMEHNSNI